MPINSDIAFRQLNNSRRGQNQAGKVYGSSVARREEVSYSHPKAWLALRRNSEAT